MGFSGMKTNQNNPRLYGEKLSLVEGSSVYSSSAERSKFLYIPLRNVVNSWHEMKEKVGSGFVMVRSTF